MPKRPQNSINFNIDFDANPEGPRPLLTLVVWAGKAPGEAPQEPQGRGGGRLAPSAGVHARVLQTLKQYLKNIVNIRIYSILEY